MFWKDIIGDDVGVCEEGFRQGLYCLNKQNNIYGVNNS
jgi:hypothetical protein